MTLSRYDPNADRFTCAKYHGPFAKIRGDAEALAESEALWGKTPDADYLALWSVCFQHYLQWYAAELAAGRMQ